jgi:hypothetical protein
VKDPRVLAADLHGGGRPIQRKGDSLRRLQSDRGKVSKPQIDVGAVVKGESSPPESSVITAALANPGERGGEAFEDDAVPVFP